MDGSHGQASDAYASLPGMIAVMVTVIAAYAALVSTCSAGWQVYLYAQGRRERSFPAEMRPLLRRVQKVVDDVISTPRDREWVVEHVSPLRDELGPVVALVRSGRGRSGARWFRLHEMSAYLVLVDVNAVTHHDSQAEIARKTAGQLDAARKARDVAIEILTTQHWTN
jgi:hypothetical protein